MGKREQYEYTEIYRNRILRASAAQAPGTETGAVLPDTEGLTFATFLLDTTNVAGGGTLDVKIQGSYDEGATWTDIAAFAQVTAAGQRYLTLSGVGAAGAEFAGSDGTLAAATVRVIAIPDRLRTKAIAVTGTYTWSCRLVGRRD